MAAKSTKSKTTGKKTNATAKKPSSNKKTTRKTTKKTTGKRKTAGRKSTGNGNSFLIDTPFFQRFYFLNLTLVVFKSQVFSQALYIADLGSENPAFALSIWFVLSNSS